MNVWIRKVRKKATCTHELCQHRSPEPPYLLTNVIQNGEYCVVTQWYMNTTSGKNWVKQRIFHPQCWIDRAIAELERRIVIETRGRQKLPMTDKCRTARLNILRKRASIIQRIKAALEVNDYDRILRLGEKLDKCKVEIKQYGGVPAKW